LLPKVPPHTAHEATWKVAEFKARAVLSPCPRTPAPISDCFANSGSTHHCCAACVVLLCCASLLLSYCSGIETASFSKLLSISKFRQVFPVFAAPPLRRRRRNGSHRNHNSHSESRTDRTHPARPRVRSLTLRRRHRQPRRRLGDMRSGSRKTKRRFEHSNAPRRVCRTDDGQDRATHPRRAKYGNIRIRHLSSAYPSSSVGCVCLYYERFHCTSSCDRVPSAD
jgi:hypothetical protein